ncbi:hypothetical protein [Roseovarius sp. D0-M9]|uniref:hypothetical protein n=1 Tax=Roseovarius sp. D0-M9 TaxID=3127117 RepID=UPI003010605E
MIPSEIAAGITFRVPLSFAEYPAPDWELSLVLRGPTVIDLIATGVGDDHTFLAQAAATGAWAPGSYWWQIRASGGGDVVLLGEGQTKILADIAAVTGAYDGRSHAQRVLEAIEAVIEGRASVDQESYSINNRSLSRTPIADLLKLRDRYRAEVNSAAAARAGKILGRIHRVRFS